MSRKTYPYQFILASTSPRRKTLFERLDIPFQIMAPQCDEIITTGIPLNKAIEALAYEKAKSVADQLAASLSAVIVSADTLVVLGDTILGKPSSQENAIKILSNLSGNTCHVITGYCVLNTQRQEYQTDSVTTQIKFKNITKNEITEYVKTGDPMDKAGAFGIQGQARQFIDTITGDYDNVVGLPITHLRSTLSELGFI